MVKIITSDKGESLYKYSEIFSSFQGEGQYTGQATAWIRFFLCNLTCNGFGQKDPTDPSTYVLPYETFDISSISKIEDLPVWDYGCDSSYTWAKQFRHLAHDETPKQICDNISNSFVHPTNPSGLFRHPKTFQHTHMAFTGGEPMLNQGAIVDILDEFHRRENFPTMVTVETNGTRPFKKVKLDKYINTMYVQEEREWFWSCSPKLFSTSGEKFKKAIRPEVVASYAELGCPGQLKYVVNGTNQSWDEVEQATELFRNAGCDWDVYIMPVGATQEQQQEKVIADIAVEAIHRGYAVSGRLHCYIFGNKIGT